MHKLYLIYRNFGKQLTRQNISAFSASTAFFLFLSLVPMLVLFCAIIPYTPLTEEVILELAAELTPDRVNPLLLSLIGEVYDASATVLPVAAVMMVWTASQGVLAMTRGLNAVNEVVEERNYFLLRLIASVYTLIILAVMMLSLVLMVFGNSLVDFTVRQIPHIEMLFSFLMPFRFLLVWLILMLVFSAIYAYVPNKKLKFREQLPGAAFSAVVWGMFSWAFSMYVDNTNAFSIYGSLSIIIILMLWLYFCIYIIMVGAHINRYFKPVYRYFYQKKHLTKQEEVTKISNK